MQNKLIDEVNAHLGTKLSYSATVEDVVMAVVRHLGTELRRLKGEILPAALDPSGSSPSPADEEDC